MGEVEEEFVGEEHLEEPFEEEHDEEEEEFDEEEEEHEGSGLLALADEKELYDLIEAIGDESAQPLSVVIHALIVNSGDISSARRYLSMGVGLTENGNKWHRLGIKLWSHEDDVALLNDDDTDL